MAQNYTRQSAFSDGDTITATLFNDEYNQLVNTFTYSSSDASATGHRHDGSTGEGGNIYRIGDLDFLNKIEADSTNNRWGFWVEVSSIAVEQLRIQDGAIVPVTDNDIDLGTSSLEFKNLYLDGTAKVDTLVVDETATITGAATLSSTLTVEGATTLNGNTTIGNAATDTVTITADVSSNIIPSADSTYTLGDSSNYWSAGYIDAITTTGNVSIGGNLTVTGNATISGNLTFGDADTDTVSFSADVSSHILPDVDDTYDLGSSTKEWRNLYVDGTANIDSLVADTADINGGTIDGATIATSDVTVGAGKTLDVSAGTLTLADNQISGDKVEGGTIAATTITSLASTTIDTTNIEVTNLKAKDGTAAGSIADATGVVTFASSVLTTTDINGGTIDGATIGATTPAAGTFTTGDFNTSLNVDGTVTADGLTVDGTASFTAAAPYIDLFESDTTDINSRIVSNSGSLRLQTVADSGSGATNRLLIDHSTGDISFYEDTGTTAQLVWDASADALTFGDSVKATFGAGSDLQIYHDGTYNFINAASGQFIFMQADELRLRSSTSETYFAATLDGATTLYHDASAKLSTTATGVNVTGTVTADGLTVDGDVVIDDNDATPLVVKRSGGTDANTSVQFEQLTYNTYLGTDASGGFTIGRAADLGTQQALKAAQNGDISFYEDTGTTAKLAWSASNERLTLSGSDYQFGIAQGANQPWYLRGVSDGGFRLHLNGTGDILTASSAGNVGIGRTSNSVVRLSVAGTDATSSNYAFEATNNSNATKFIVRNDGQSQFFKSDNSASMTITSAGNVGIGTTSPAADLHVSNAAGSVLRIDTQGGTNADSVLNFRENGVDRASLYWDGADNDLYLETTAGDIALMPSGNVGIGTTSPARLLHVEANTDGGTGGLIKNASAGSSAYTNLIVRNDSNKNIEIGIQSSARTTTYPANEGWIYVSDALNLGYNGATKLYAGGAERMRIDSSGNVGIGTSSPSYKLDVSGAFRSDSWIGRSNVSAPTADAAIFRAADNTIGFSTANTERARLDASGNLLVGKTATNYNNDGFQAFSGGFVHATGTQAVANSGTIATLNRKSTDGSIIDFRKDGAAVGSIRSKFGDLVIGNSGTVGIRFDEGAGLIPWDMTADSGEDAQHDIGASTARYKDLYLSGDIYLSNGSDLKFKDSGGTNRDILTFDSSNDVVYASAGAGVNNHIWKRNGSEYMRLDTSGNLLVGKTAVGLASTGFQALASGNQSAFVSDGDRALILNRQTSDGSILEFRKDGTTVGSIGTDSSGNLQTLSATGNYRFGDSSTTRWSVDATRMYPMVDASYDIGVSSVRVRDLYLSGYVKTPAGGGIRSDGALYLQSDASGTTKSAYLNTNGDFVFGTSTQGIYLGGTSSANKLDDYEEGTWTGGTLVVTNCSSVTTSNLTYTKIGRLVTLQGQFNLTVTSANTETRITFTAPFSQSITLTPATGSAFGNFGSNAFGRIMGVVVNHTGSNAVEFTVIFPSADVVAASSKSATFSITYETT